MQDELKPLLARGSLKQSLTLIYDLFWLNRLFRFPMMTPAQLADLLLSPLLRRHMEFMMERMAGAMAYHRNSCISYLNTFLNHFF